MQRCPDCDHIQLIEAARCERCGAVLPVTGASGPPAGSLEAEIVDLAGTRGKIEAIKRYRQATSSSLKEAKEAVERIMAEYNIRAAGGSGCAGMLLAAAGVAATSLLALLLRCP